MRTYNSMCKTARIAGLAGASMRAGCASMRAAGPKAVATLEFRSGNSGRRVACGVIR